VTGDGSAVGRIRGHLLAFDEQRDRPGSTPPWPRLNG
jgi:hypothetical protein